MVDELPVPDRLEDPVRKAQSQQVLHGLLAEVVVDPEDLVLGEVLADQRRQLFCGGEVVSERLLDDEPVPPLPGGDRRHHRDERLECAGRNREVVQPVAGRPANGLGLGKCIREPRGGTLVGGRVEHQVAHPIGQLVPDLLPERIAGVVFDSAPHRLAEAVVRPIRPRDADDGELLGKKPAEGERVERRHQLALGQVARGAEDHERARRRPPPQRQPFEQRIELFDRGAHSADFTACPPNWLRSAALTLAANDSSCREANRANRAAEITGTGTSSAIASAIVQRPSPESST